MSLYLGVDLGTSSAKATLADGEGQVRFSLKRGASLLSPREGFFEVDAEKVWWGNFLSICEELFSGRAAPSPRAVCVSSVCGSFVPVDRDFRPLHNAVLYGIDRRSEAIVAELNARYGEAFLRERLGGAFSTHSVLPKILWFKRNRPDVYARTAYFVSSGNFVSARLTGAASWDVPTAYGALMLDETTESAPLWFFEDQGLDAEKIPSLGPATEPLGIVTERAAAETGIAPGTVVMRGACDVNAEAMAAGAVLPGSALAVFGSTVSLLFNTKEPRRLDGFMAGRSLFPGVWRIGAATASGGLTVDWSRSLSAEGSVPPGPTGIYFIPYLNGARTPFNAPDARGAFLGLRASHTGKDMAAAVWESLGYELAALIAKIEEVEPFPSVLEVSGGLSNVPELMQLLADVTGRALRLHIGVDASYGDALLAMTADAPYAARPEARTFPLVRPGERSTLYRGHAENYRQLSEIVARLGFSDEKS